MPFCMMFKRMIKMGIQLKKGIDFFGGNDF